MGCRVDVVAWCGGAGYHRLVMDESYSNRRSCYRRFCRRSLQLAACLALLLVPTTLAADTDVPDPEAEGLSILERLEVLIERIKFEQRNLRTMEANFTQRKESIFLVEPEESEGRFWYHSPDRVRWDFKSPNETTVLISQNEMLTWFKDLGTAERVNVGKQADRVMEYLSAGNSLETLQRYFEIRTTFSKDPTAPYKLELRPKFKRVEKKIKGMSIHLHRTGFYPVYLRYVDPDDDKTEFFFEDVVVNETIDETRFALELPDDVDVKVVELGKKAKKDSKGE